MINNFTALILLIASIGVFVFIINPDFDASRPESLKSLINQNNSYKTALQTATGLKAKRDKIVEDYKKIENKKSVVEEIVPDGLDTIRLILYLNTMADKYGFSVKNIKFSNIENKEDKKNAASKETKQLLSSNKYKNAQISFSINTSYDNFNLFLSDVESSLKVLDVTSVSVKANDTGVYDYNLTIQTYYE